MALPVPNLDDRRFQDLVDDAKRLVQQKCPEWTDHNVSDPGVTLIETFAWMTDQLIYRLNRVPDRNYVKFLELIGVNLFPPTAARSQVKFWLSAPQQQPVVLATGTEVATVRTQTEDAVVFATERELSVIPCELSYLVVQRVDQEAVDRTVGNDHPACQAIGRVALRGGDRLDAQRTQAAPFLRRDLADAVKHVAKGSFALGGLGARRQNQAVGCRSDADRA